MKEEPEKKNTKKILLSLVAVCLLLLVVIGTSYAIFTFVGIGTKENSITSGTVTIIYTEGNKLQIENAMPMSDDAGMALIGTNNVFTFTIQANIIGDTQISYEVAAVKKQDNTLTDDEIKLYLEKNEIKVLNPTHYIPIEEQTEIGSPVGSMIIDRGVFTKTTTNEYTMKMWVDEKTEISDKVKHYTVTVNVYAKDGNILEDNISNQLIKKANDKSVTNYGTGNKKEMFTFSHSATEQQEGYTEEELTDYRYIGSEPNNYVYFNCDDPSDTSTCEVWRIIGSFTVEDKLNGGKKERRTKLLRGEPIGNYSYDCKQVNEGSSDSPNGSNEWSDAQVNVLLNDLYYNRKSGICHIDAGKTTDCDFTSTGLTESAKKMIGDAKLYLGGMSNWNVSIETYYNQERGTTVYTGKPRSLNDISKVALAYPSDYGYTFAYGVNNKCFNSVNYCERGTPTTSWMYQLLTRNKSIVGFLITPRSTEGSGITYIAKSGYASGNYKYCNANAITPSVYLKSNIKIIGGTGEKTSPYILK